MIVYEDQNHEHSIDDASKLDIDETKDVGTEAEADSEGVGLYENSIIGTETARDTAEVESNEITSPEQTDELEASNEGLTKNLEENQSSIEQLMEVKHFKTSLNCLIIVCFRKLILC